MKRTLCFITVVILCLLAVSPAFAAKTEFVPSISYKDHPPVVPVDPGQQEQPDDDVVAEIIDKDKDETLEDVTSQQLVVTPVSDAETTTQIPQSVKDKLIHVYEQLESGEMTLPYDKINPNMDTDDVVVRDLFDVSIVDDRLNEILVQDNTVLQVTFDLGVAADVDVYVMTYVNEEWIPAVSVTNNGDGTVTVELSSTGPVVFSVKTQGRPPAQTGDQVGPNLPIWIAVMGVSAAALILILVFGRRKAQ